MKNLIAMAVVSLAASSTMAMMAAPDYYVRGDFNGWSGTADLMTSSYVGIYDYTVTGLTPGQAYELKVTTDDWSFNAPGSNAKIPADANGEIKLNFFDSTSWSDGWMPDAKPRLGWEDPGTFDWELIGGMNGWGGGNLLTDMGGGLHVGEFALPAGTHEFKFRSVGSWDFSIGDDTGNAAANNSIDVASAGDIWRFEIDLTNGRWKATYVPEPASLALLGLGGLAIFRRR